MPDPQYKTVDYVFQSRGVVARYVIDRMPPGTYANLLNWEARQENALSTRLGRVAITDDGANNQALADTDIHTLGRLKGLSDTYRYAGAGANLYRRTGDTPGAYATINGSNALSGNRFSMTKYRPARSAFPYIFFADQDQMLKDNGALGTAQRWGIFRPTIPPALEVQAASKTDIELFEDDTALNFDGNFGTVSTPNRVNTDLDGALSGAPGIIEATPTAMTDILVGSVLKIDTGGGNEEDVVVISRTAATFTANFVNNHADAETVINKSVKATAAADATANVDKTTSIDLSLVGSSDAEDDDEINLYIKVDDPLNVEEIRLIFDVGGGTFDEDYFLKAMNPATIQPFISGNIFADRMFSDRMFDRASGRIDFDRSGRENLDGPIRREVLDELIDDLSPDDDAFLGGLRGATLLMGKNRWSRITIKRSEFLKIGLAGTAGFDWEDVGAWRISVKTRNSAVVMEFDDLYLTGGAGPDVFGGVPYDYRYTYYNINTGAESDPSQTLIDSSFVSPRRHPVKIIWTASPDTDQVTHVRVYRRGGTLSDAWRQVAEIPVGTLTTTDTLPDRLISLLHQLEIDNGPPVESTLPSPVDTTLGTAVSAGASTAVTPGSMTDIFADQIITIDEGENEETVIIQSITGSTFTAYFQIAHGTTARVRADTRSGRALNLAAQGYERMWLAGDPDNPHFLYYSKKQNPESFPPQNFIEVGTPDDPIMAVINYRSQIFVFTLSTVHRVVSPGATVPVPAKTSTKHGLFASFGWVEAEGVIWYQSYDGVYRFNGDNSDYMSEPVEWLFNQQNLGPVLAMNLTQISDTLYSYDQNEVFISYVDTGGNRRRLMWDTTYNRFRNDDVPATAMLFETDSFELVIARDNGMIYRDRTGDFDGAGFSASVQQIDPYTAILQMVSDDHGVRKADKIYNELTIDIDTKNVAVTVDLLFDNGTTVVNLGTVTTANRQRVNFNIGSGLGQTSENVALRLTAIVDAANEVITVFEAYIRAYVEAEKRKSFDSYWSRYGTDEWKIIKQGWFEYVAADAGGIAFDVYVEGSATPEFTFTLPQSTTRTAKRKRFPAVKAKIWRWVATSADDFQLYDESHLEIAPVGGNKGFSKAKMAA